MSRNEFLQTVLDFCETTEMPITTLGRLAVNDPRFVHDLKNGRDPSTRVKDKVLDFMRGVENAT